MLSVGVLIETSSGAVKTANFGVLTAARKGTGHRVYALVLGGDGAQVKQSVERYGAEKVIAIRAAGADIGSSPEGQARALADAVRHFGLSGLLGLSSPKGRDLLIRVAILLDAPVVLDCLAVDLAARTAVKSHFSGKTLATLKVSAEVMICGIQPNAIEAAEEPLEAQLLTHTVQVSDAGRIRVREVKSAGPRAVDLSEADIIITGGRPIGAAENFKLLRECAAVLGAAVGASRAAVDAGFAPHSMQVGQTGKTVSPRLYIGCGLSGSVQHFAGMKRSRVIVAINTDKDAPIFGKCDYGIVGDLFEVVPVLTEELRKAIRG